MWRFTTSNGITEGFQTKPEMISRVRMASGILKITHAGHRPVRLERFD